MVWDLFGTRMYSSNLMAIRENKFVVKRRVKIGTYIEHNFRIKPGRFVCNKGSESFADSLDIDEDIRLL